MKISSKYKTERNAYACKMENRKVVILSLSLMLIFFRYHIDIFTDRPSINNNPHTDTCYRLLNGLKSFCVCLCNGKLTN